MEFGKSVLGEGLTVKKPEVIETRNMRKLNKAYICNDIQQVDWEATLNPCCNNTTDMATMFQIFESILDLRAPFRRKRVRSDFAPWVTPSLKKLILERDKLKVQAEKSPEILKQIG